MKGFVMAKESVENIKAQSQGLRGSLADELGNDENYFTEAAKQLIKFHGMYQYEDRDARQKDRTAKQYQFMIRTKLPGGKLTAEQYLAQDEIASAYGNDTLRITTRQCFQFHGVIRDDLRDTLQALNRSFVTTFGACGDVVRNVIACPVPTADPQRAAVQDFAQHLTQALFPKTNAYHQIWLDGQAMIDERITEEPLYGPTYLPRKFKIAIAFAGDNCVDVFTNDVGLIALFDEANRLQGFNVVVGGGMGLTHNNEETFARLADMLGFVTPEQVIETVKGIVTLHRDYGDRTNRKHARLKYVLHEWGIDRFREELRTRLTFLLQSPRPMPDFKIHDHLGWQEQGEGLWYLGLPVENGRIADRLRGGLRAIVEKFQLSVRLTPQQNILLTGIPADQRFAIDQVLAEFGIRTVEQISMIRRYSLACPALPTCGLAITEAERALPDVLSQLEVVLEDLGLGDEPISIRMTGCPNGCARPYVAEIAFVGRSLNKYMIYLGGSIIGTRLAQPFLDLVHTDHLVSTLRPILKCYRDQHLEAEAFGDFCQRVGLDHLRSLTDLAAAAD
jgi:sulfite reductase (ferredoxin)